MSKTLYLHIGMGRCGSSAIQHFAAEKQTELLRRGVCYPNAKDFGFEIGAAGNALPIARDETVDKALPLMSKYVSQSSADRFLLSSEHLYSQSTDYLDRIRQEFTKKDINVCCVVYIREQREWLISRYAQALKSKRWKIELEDYLREHYNNDGLDYSKKFQALAQVFGHELIIRLFRREMLHGGDIRTDLFDLMNVEVVDLIKDQPTINASASVLEMETMRAINAVVSDGAFNHRLFLRRCQTFFEANGWQVSHDAYRLVKPSVMRDIKDFYREKNIEFQRRFFPDRGDELFPSKIPDEYELLSGHERINEKSIAMLLHYFMTIDEDRAHNPPPKNGGQTNSVLAHVRHALGL